MPSSLGDDFWGNFYRIDADRYTFQKIHEEVQGLLLKVELGADATEAEMTEVRGDLLAVKAHLRKKGFRPPSSKDKNAVCVWDLTQVRSCNSTNLKIFLV